MLKRGAIPSRNIPVETPGHSRVYGKTLGRPAHVMNEFDPDWAPHVSVASGSTTTGSSVQNKRRQKKQTLARGAVHHQVAKTPPTVTSVMRQVCIADSVLNVSSVIVKQEIIEEPCQETSQVENQEFVEETDVDISHLVKQELIEEPDMNIINTTKQEFTGQLHMSGIVRQVCTEDPVVDANTVRIKQEFIEELSQDTSILIF